MGSAVERALRSQGCRNISVRTHGELDLTDAAAVRRFYQSEKPEVVFLAAARVGGIHANNTFPGEFIYQNLAIQTNVIHEAWRHGVQDLVYFGSGCMYPKLCEQPMREEALLTGALEPTNEPYAVAKIAGMSMCLSYNRQYQTNYRVLIPTNLYGIEDNFHPDEAHVIPAILRRFHAARERGDESISIWGTGQARREFLCVDDMVEGCFFLLEHYKENKPINIGFGTDVSIAELAETVKEVVGFKGRLEFDTSKPDGMPRKLVDSTRMEQLGWKANTFLREGLASVYAWYLDKLKHPEGARL